MKCETMTVIRDGSPVRINVEDYDPKRDSLPEAPETGGGEGQASDTPDPNAKPAETGGEGAKAPAPQGPGKPQPLPKGGK